MPSGYSGTPLWKKLGLKPEMLCAVVNPPADYLNLLIDAPEVVWGDHDTPDFVHIFGADRAEMIRQVAKARTQIAHDGMIWVSWPKKASNVPTDITEDVIRATMLGGDLVDVKVCAVDSIWSGLKLVIRKEKR